MSDLTITSADGTELAARRSGRGTPLVLVHGGNGDLESFALIEAALSRPAHRLGVLPPGARGQWRRRRLCRAARGRRCPGRPGRDRRPSPPRRTLRRRRLLPVGGHGNAFDASPSCCTNRRYDSTGFVMSPDGNGRGPRPSSTLAIRAAALELVFPVVGVTEQEIDVLRSLDPVRRDSKRGSLFPREIEAGLEEPPRPVGLVRAARHPNALPVRRGHKGADLPDPRRSRPAPAHGRPARPCRATAPRLRLRPDHLRRSSPQLHRVTRRVSHTKDAPLSV